MVGTAETVGVPLDEIEQLTETVANLLGHAKAGAVVQVASLVFFDAAETASVVGAPELEQIREYRGRENAAAQEATRSSAQRCISCDATIRVCHMTHARTTSDDQPSPKFCQQEGCGTRAAERFAWPGGGGWTLVCTEHARRAIAIADAMGFLLTIEPLDAKE